MTKKITIIANGSATASTLSKNSNKQQPRKSQQPKTKLQKLRASFKRPLPAFKKDAVDGRPSPPSAPVPKPAAASGVVASSPLILPGSALPPNVPTPCSIYGLLPKSERERLVLQMEQSLRAFVPVHEV